MLLAKNEVLISITAPDHRFVDICINICVQEMAPSAKSSPQETSQVCVYVLSPLLCPLELSRQRKCRPDVEDALNNNRF